MPPRSTVTARDVERVAEVVADRLRHLAPRRLEPIEAQVGVLLNRLAAVALKAEGLEPRPLPATSPRAFGDLVSVLVHDLVEAAGAGGAGSTELDDAHALLVAVRRLV
jgi:hypothetical protein